MGYIFKNLLFTLPLLFIILSAIKADTDSSGSKAQELFQQGDALLSSKKYEDAIRSYSQALDKETDYVRVYKRATAYLATNRINKAIDDFKAAIIGQPSFIKAYEQLIELLFKNGDLDSAKDTISSLKHSSSEAKSSSPIIKEFQDKINTVSSLKSKLKAQIESAEKKTKSSSQADNSLLYDPILITYSELIKLMPREYSLRRQRIDFLLKLSKFDEAIVELRNYLGNVENSLPISKLQEDFVLLSKLQSLLSAPDSSGIGASQTAALKTIKSCLRSDPENKVCLVHRRKIKSLSNLLVKFENFYSSNKFNSAFKVISSSDHGDLLKLLKDQTGELSTAIGVHVSERQSKLIGTLYKMGCECLVKIKRYSDSVDFCSTGLEYNNNDPNILLNIATSKISLSEESEDSDVKVKRLNEALSSANKVADDSVGDFGSFLNEDQIRSIKKRAQILVHEINQKLKVASRKDYYKILNVKRGASPSEIKKQYRKLAHKNHPDRVSDPEKKKLAESKMAELNSAYEILKDKEKREAYDNGVDPNDPQSGREHDFFRQHQQNHYQQHAGFHGQGFPFGSRGKRSGGGGGGGNFHFNFGGGPFEFHF
ncbi:DnaJ-like protein [Smittium mucronatum]|uniref:DnaJ-like protein n=1 Tax=Smittium mucronatum TaxID=133383 RepID=A0A1R0H6U4_9FUNG|nr:DnaJ-like protein [Smittium mucronatum]